MRFNVEEGLSKREIFDIYSEKIKDFIFLQTNLQNIVLAALFPLGEITDNDLDRRIIIISTALIKAAFREEITHKEGKPFFNINDKVTIDDVLIDLQDEIMTEALVTYRGDYYPVDASHTNYCGEPGRVVDFKPLNNGQINKTPFVYKVRFSDGGEVWFPDEWFKIEGDK